MQTRWCTTHFNVLEEFRAQTRSCATHLNILEELDARRLAGVHHGHEITAKHRDLSSSNINSNIVPKKNRVICFP